MSHIAVIADPSLAACWARELQADGHEVRCHWGTDSAETLFAGDYPEIIVIDIENPRWSESMLIPQSHAQWPTCKVIAVVSSYDFRNSAVYEMGLWEPDQLLMQPLAPRLLAATVMFLWAQLRSEEIKKLVHETPFTLPSDPEKQAPVQTTSSDQDWSDEDAKRLA